MYYVVTYTGPFGFIKPWTAVRDSETYSQQFLTPSILEGMRQKLDVVSILRHKLSYAALDLQQEQTQPRGWEVKKKLRLMLRERSILLRGVMLNPVLHLAFSSQADAERAARQHLCLCRNEDVVLPDANIQLLDEAAFDALAGFELRFGQHERAFLVGFNRFDQASPMYGWLEITGKPVYG